MSRIHPLFLCAAIIFVMITAGCIQSSGPSPLVTEVATPVPTPMPSAPADAGTMPPAAGGTQPAGTCNADIMNDAANCGGCGYACPANALCQQGQCYCMEGYTVENNACAPATTGGTVTGSGCPEGMSPCPDGYCYELAYDAMNCGICGNQCPAGMICSASTCTNVPTESTTAPETTAAAGTTTTTTTTTTSSTGPSWSLGPGVYELNCVVMGLSKCGSSCVNLSTSNGNCGSCGHICSGIKPTCCDGTCTNLKSDKFNCGTCGHKCGTFAICEMGSCKASVYGSIVVTQAIPKVTVSVPKIQKEIVFPGY